MKYLREMTLLTAFIALILFGTTGSQSADASSSGNVEIKNLKIDASPHRYQLDAEISLRLSESLQQALTHGVKVNSLLNIYLGKHRSWWWNSSERIAQIALQLRYHSLSKQYIVTRLDNQQSWNFGNLPRALRHMGFIRDYILPLDPANVGGGNYYIYTKAVVSAEKLSFPLKLQSWFNDKYVMESEGVLWSLP